MTEDRRKAVFVVFALASLTALVLGVVLEVDRWR